MITMCTESIARNATREHTTLAVVYLDEFAYKMAALTSWQHRNLHELSAVSRLYIGRPFSQVATLYTPSRPPSKAGAMLSTPSIWMSHGVAPADSMQGVGQSGLVSRRVQVIAAVPWQTAESRLAVCRKLAVVDFGGRKLIDCVPIGIIVVVCVGVKPGFVTELVLVVIAFLHNLIVVQFANAIVVVVQARA